MGGSRRGGESGAAQFTVEVAGFRGESGIHPGDQLLQGLALGSPETDDHELVGPEQGQVGGFVDMAEVDEQMAAVEKALVLARAELSEQEQKRASLTARCEALRSALASDVDEEIEAGLHDGPLDSLMREWRHTRIDYLKLDIEGAEYRVVDYLGQHNLPVHVLYLEYHYHQNTAPLTNINMIKSSLEQLFGLGYRVFYHSERCDFGLVRSATEG